MKPKKHKSLYFKVCGNNCGLRKVMAGECKCFHEDNGTLEVEEADFEIVEDNLLEEPKDEADKHKR